MSDIPQATLDQQATSVTPKYWAFISYSHLDQKWGRWLHRRLERYRIPRKLVGRMTPVGVVPRRLFPIFLDESELPAAADLGPSLREELEDSRCLIVICSPHSARSRWVAEEVLTYKRLGREKRILGLIIRGEPNASDKPDLHGEECFPEPLKYRLDSQGNLTKERVEPMSPEFKAQADFGRMALLKLIAGILGLPLDELVHRDWIVRRNRLLAAAAFTVTVLLVTLWMLVTASFTLARLTELEARRMREKLNPFGRMPDDYSSSEKHALETNEEIATRMFREVNVKYQHGSHGGDAISFAGAAFRLHRARAQNSWAQGNAEAALKELARSSVQAARLAEAYEALMMMSGSGGAEVAAARQFALESDITLSRMMRYLNLKEFTVESKTTEEFDGRSNDASFGIDPFLIPKPPPVRFQFDSDGVLRHYTSRDSDLDPLPNETNSTPPHEMLSPPPPP